MGGRTVRRGQEVLLILTSAMLDPHGYPDPGEFRAGGPNRPYLHFGHPRRECLGKAIALGQLEAIAMEVLRRPNVRRGSKLQLEGPYPRTLRVAFDAGA